MSSEMRPHERRAVANTLAATERQLGRLHSRGPWENPAAEVFWTGMSHEQKVDRVERAIACLRALL